MARRGCSAQIRVWKLLFIGFPGDWLMPKAQWCRTNDLPVVGDHLRKAVLCYQLEMVKVESLFRYISPFHRTKWLHRDALRSSLPQCSKRKNICILAKKRCNPKAYGELNKQCKEQGNSHVSYVGQSEVPVTLITAVQSSGCRELHGTSKFDICGASRRENVLLKRRRICPIVTDTILTWGLEDELMILSYCASEWMESCLPLNMPSFRRNGHHS